MAETGARCIQCGSQDVAGTWYAAVAAESCWVCGKNVPTPVAPVWVTDAMVVWQLPLCAGCLIMQYAVSQRRRARKLWISALKIGAVAVGLALLVALIAAVTAHIDVIDIILRVLLAVGMAAFVIAAVVLTIRRRRVAAARPAHEPWRTEAAAAAEGFVKARLERERAEAAHDGPTGFSLPAFASEPTEELEERLGACYLKEQRRRVVAVAPTREELERKLAEEAGESAD